MEEVKVKIGLEAGSFASDAAAISAEEKRIKEAAEQSGIAINDLNGSIKRLGEAASVSAAKFKESSDAANRLKAELEELAKSGADADTLISKARELGEAQKKAAYDGAEALKANQDYWTALSVAGADISTVRERHQELAESYIDISNRAKKTQEAVDDYSNKLKEEQERLEEVKTQADDTRKSTEDLGSSTEKAADSSKGFADKLDEVSKGAKGLPGPIGDAVSGIHGMTKATLRFIATPLGATLALISAALAAVTSWFKRTEEGQNAMAVGSAYFTQVLGSLLDVVDNVGEWLYKAFTKPKSAMVDLVEFLKGQVINRIKAVGEMAQGIWKMLNGDFSEGFNQLSNGWLQGVTGIQNAGSKVVSWIADTNKKANERMEITRRQNKLDEDERKNLVERAKLEKEINELRQKAYDKSVPEKEREKAIKAAQDKTKQMYDEELRLANERYEIIRNTNKLTHSNKEDKKKEAEAEAELYRIESQRANAIKGLMREQNRVDSASAKAGKAEDKAAKEAATLRQKQFDVEMADLERQSKEREEAYNASREAYIASIKNAGERERAAEDEQHRLNIAAINKEAEEMKKANLEAAKKAWEASNTDKTKTWADTPTAKDGWKAQSLTADQEKKITAELKKEYAERDRLLKERQQKEVQSMRDYMKEFGTLQQKRLAIQQEYDDKIANETDKTQREILEAQKKQALDAFDMEVLKAEIDWTTMFDGIGNALEEEMKATLDKVEKFIQSKSFRELDAKEKAEYVKMRNELVKKTGGGVGTFDFSIYHQIGEDMKAYQQAIRDAKIAQANHTAAVNDFKVADAELKEAEKNLAKAMNNIASNPQAAEDANRVYLDAKGKQQMADMVAKITGKKQDEAEGNVIVAQGNLTDSTTQAQQALDNFGDAISQMTSGSLRGFADGLVNLIAAIGGKNGNGLSGLGKAGGIIAAILSIIDSLGDDFGGFWEKLLDKIFTVIENSMEQTANNKIADSIISAAVNGIKHVIEAMLKGFEEQILGGKITHGLDKTLDALGISHSEEEDAYQKMIAEFENLRDIWDEIIEKKREYLSESWGTEAMKAAEEAKRIADEAIERSRQLARESLDYGASGGSHSIAYRMWDKGSYGDWRGNAANIVSDIKKAGLGDVAFGSMYDMVNMNSKQLSYIRENYRELWVGLDEDYRSALENIIKYGETVDDTLKQLDERLTTTTKENVIDEFKETMYDLADGSEDATDKIAENWQKMVNRMVVDNLVMKSMQADLEKWYDDLVALQKERTNGKIGDTTYRDRLEILKGRHGDIVESGRGMIKTFTEEGIIAPIEEATSEAKKNFESIREAWVSTVMEMKGDTESLGKEIARIMFESIVNEKVFDEEFDTWLENWTQRLEDAMNVQAPSERESRLKQLAQERADMIEELTSRTKEYAEVTGYSAEATEEFSNSLDNLGDTLLDALLDTEKDAGKMGAEIGRTLVKEMLQEILKSATYADRIADIRQMWQDILTGKDTVHTMDDVLADIAELSNDIANDDNIGKLTTKYQQLGEALEGVKTSFGDLSDLMMDSIIDVENGVENLRKKLNETLVKDLIKRQQFDVELTVNGVSFENFEAYTKDWSTRYLEALKNNDEELLQSLIDELVKQQEIMAEGAQLLTETLKKTQTDTTFKEMGNDWVSMLMNMDASASDWGEQIGRTMVEKIMKEMVMGEMMQPFLNNIQEAWNSAVANHDNQDGTFDWEAIANDNGLQTAIGAAGNQFDTLQGIVKGLFQAFHITIDEGTDEDVKKPLENLEDTILEALTDTDMDGEKLAKKIAQDFIKEMISTLRDSKFAEEIQDIRDYYQALLDGKEGYTIDELKQNVRAFYKAVSEHPTIEPLIDEWKELNKEIEDSATPFDNMRDNFRSYIMDITKTGKDLAQDLKKTFTEEFVDKFVMGEAFDKVMQDFEDDYLKIMGNKSLSKEERAEQGKQIIAAAQKYYEAQKAEAKTWGDLMGINSKEDQSAYMNTAQSFNYDQADLIGGMVTSILMGQTEGNKVRQEILATLRAMDGITNPNSEVFAEIQENISRSANYLSHIEQAVSRIDTAVARNAAAVSGILSKLS